jgi:hypothetical protein
MKHALFPHPQPTLLILTPKDEDILKYFAEYRFLTAQEITHLCYSKGSLTYARARLSALSGNKDITDKGLNYDFPLWRWRFPTGRAGSQERIWCLSPTGAEIVKQLGRPAPWHINPAKLKTYSHSYFLHDLTRNRFIVSLLAWAKSRPNLSIEPHLAYELSKQPPTVEISVQRSVLDEKGKMVKVPVMTKVGVIPDGEILITNTSTGERLIIILEIDQNTQAEARLRNHITTRLAYVRSQHFRNTYSNIAYRIVYATQAVTESAAKARLTHLCEFSMKLLRERQQQQDSQYFRFTTISFATLYDSATRLFGTEEPSWYVPGEWKRQSPVALFTGAKPQTS